MYVTDEKFQKFHEENPQIYLELLALTQQAVDHGRNKIGIQMLAEVIRWNRWIKSNDPDFKINNNYNARYARLIMAEHPEFGPIFNLRELKR